MYVLLKNFIKIVYLYFLNVKNFRLYEIIPYTGRCSQRYINNSRLIRNSPHNLKSKYKKKNMKC